MIELLKLLLSKDFISNAKDIVRLLRKSTDWKKDIVKLRGTFYYKDKIESSVLINETIKILKVKEWEEEEQDEVRFILNEIFENSFEYGTPNKELSFVSADITVTSTFFKLTIEDYGLQFDLIQELKNQEAFNPESDKHKGLSFVNKLTPEIYQEISPNKNTVIVIKREGLRPLEIRKVGSVVVFEVGNSTYINDENFSIFVDKIKSVAENEKVVIDFGASQNMMISMAYRKIRTELIQAEIQSGLQISVCGLERTPFAIKEYFSKKFPKFATLQEAIEYHNN